MPRAKAPAKRPVRASNKKRADTVARIAPSRPHHPTPPPGRSTSPIEQDYDDITDPTEVDRPVDAIIHPNLRGFWKIYEDRPMCFIFDAVNPARVFVRGCVYSDDTPFAEHTDENLENATETDEQGELNQFQPITHQRKYYLRCSISVETFLVWRQGQLGTIGVGVQKRGSKKLHWTNKILLVPYIRIACQLKAEYTHGTKHRGHEAVRRQTYAAMVMDAFGEELMKYKGEPVKFRSVVLTPIMQRHLCGAPDAYTPTVQAVVKQGERDIPSIADATEYYLSWDPVEPSWIPNFRHNIVYIPEVRWHLAVLMEVHDLSDGAAYNRVRDNQDRLMRDLRMEANNDNKQVEIPLFGPAEVRVIVMERLEEYFKEELAQVPELLKAALEDRVLRDQQEAILALRKAQPGGSRPAAQQRSNNAEGGPVRLRKVNPPDNGDIYTDDLSE